MPKLINLLRTSPFRKVSNFEIEIDDAIKNIIESILNINLIEQQWTQASLPIRFGGIGI